MVSSLYNKFDGQRIFLIGNGPSLNDTPLNKLRSENTLAMNGINEIYDSTDWRPDFYYLTNSPEADISPRTEYAKENVDSGVTCFLSTEYRQFFAGEENVYYLTKRNLKSNPLYDESGLHDLDVDEVKNMDKRELSDFWSDDPSEKVYIYHSMYGALQLLTYLGFDEIYIVGADLGFSYYDPHMLFDDGLDPHKYEENIIFYINEATSENVLISSLTNALFYLLITKFEKASNVASKLVSSDRDSHMVSNYLNSPKDMRYANREIPKSHLVAKKMIFDRDVEIYNATLGGELEVYPRVELEELV